MIRCEINGSKKQGAVKKDGNKRGLASKKHMKLIRVSILRNRGTDNPRCVTCAIANAFSIYLFRARLQERRSEDYYSYEGTILL